MEEDILVITPPEDIPVTTDYFLTDTDTYQVPLFTVNFAVCELTYSFEVNPVLLNDEITFDSNAEQRLFTYNFALDASYLNTYEVKAIASVSQAPSVSEFVTWDLTVHYPCTNTDFITISGSPPVRQYYALFTDSFFAPYQFSHDKFTIDLQGSDDNTLCGGLTYSAEMDGASLAADDSYPPVAYLVQNQQFFVFSEDYDFDGIKVITVDAYMTDYAMHTHQIEFELEIYNPCSDP